MKTVLALTLLHLSVSCTPLAAGERTSVLRDFLARILVEAPTYETWSQLIRIDIDLTGDGNLETALCALDSRRFNNTEWRVYSRDGGRICYLGKFAAHPGMLYWDAEAGVLVTAGRQQPNEVALSGLRFRRGGIEVVDVEVGEESDVRERPHSRLGEWSRKIDAARRPGGQMGLVQRRMTRKEVEASIETGARETWWPQGGSGAAGQSQGAEVRPLLDAPLEGSGYVIDCAEELPSAPAQQNMNVPPRR